MKRLVQLIGEKAYAIGPENWDSKEHAVSEIRETFKDPDFNPFLEAISEWVFESYGDRIDMEI